VWDQDKKCVVCDEICPYDAIEFVEVDRLWRPIVAENRCTGCGKCEHKCPVQGQSAIIVVRKDEMRLSTGSYRLEAQRLEYDFSGVRSPKLNTR
jgi:ferredoxin